MRVLVRTASGRYNGVRGGTPDSDCLLGEGHNKVGWLHPEASGEPLGTFIVAFPVKEGRRNRKLAVYGQNKQIRKDSGATNLV